MNTVMKPAVLSFSDIEIDIDKLVLKLKTSAPNLNLMDSAKAVLNKVSGVWNPKVVYRWCQCQDGEHEKNEYSILCNGDNARFNLGHSGQFLEMAHLVLIAAYTAGDELDKAGNQATRDGQFLDAYLIDLIGLLVLQRMEILVKRTVERRALELGWGVSPFLSPGSVHGWDLEEQAKLCSLLPCGEAGLTIGEDFVLRPFKSISCLIGIGPGYTATSVGETCQVCTKRDNCQMK